jgi:hypothetical protein
MPSVDCLFDTNSIIKRYHGERGTRIVDYLFNSPKVRINLLNIQVIEVIKAFYKIRKDNRVADDQARDTLIDTFLKDIDTGDGSKKIKLYDFSNEHLKDMGVYRPVTDIEPKTIEVWNKKLKKKEIKQKRRSNTVDTIMLIVMREVKFINESYGLESYLVACDEHVIDVAKSLGISIINPETVPIGSLPVSLDIREHKRHSKRLKAICTDSKTGQSLGSTSTVDICGAGLKVHHLGNLTHGRMINFRLEAFDGSCKPLETRGEICWLRPGYCGVKLSELMPDSFLNSLSVN